MEKKPFSRDAQNIVDEICESDDHLHFDLYYPQHSSIKNFIVGLMDTRATDEIRISFNHERNGWVIEQPTVSQWEVGEEPDPVWKEVAFINPWGSDKRMMEELGE